MAGLIPAISAVNNIASFDDTERVENSKLKSRFTSYAQKQEADRKAKNAQREKTIGRRSKTNNQLERDKELGRKAQTAAERRKVYRDELKAHADEMEKNGDPSWNSRLNRAFEDYLIAPLAAATDGGVVKSRLDNRGKPSAVTRTDGPNPLDLNLEMQRARKNQRKKLKKKAKKATLVSKIAMIKNAARRRPPARRYIPPNMRRMNRIIDIPRAPVSKMATVNSGHRIRFHDVKGGIGLEVHMRIAQIRVDGTGLLITFNTVGGPCQDLSIIPNNTFYFPTYITNLTRLFDIYRVNYCSISIEPRQSTAQTASYVVASTPEPEWVESRGQLTAGLATPSESSMVTLENACTTVCYDRCTSKGKPFKGPMPGGFLYMAGANIASQVSYTTQNAAELRGSMGAQWLIAGTPGGLAANTLLADVYLDINFSMKGFSTSMTTAVSLTPPVVEKKEEKKLEVVEKGNPFSDDDEPGVVITPVKSSSRKSNRGL